MQGLALVVRLLANEGQSVVIEQPTYSSVGPLMQASGVRARGVPMLDDGMDLDALSALLRRSSRS
jgi:DNA-binding transcriptional MocR family regulator